MNIVKIQDTVMTPEVLEAAGYAVKTNIRYAKENSQYWKVGDRRYDEEPVIEHKDATPEEPECWIVNNTDKYFEEPTIVFVEATPEVLEKWVFVDDVNDRRIEYDHEPVIEYHPTQPEVPEHWIIDGDEENPVYTEPQIEYHDPVPAVIEKWTLDGVDYDHKPVVEHHDSTPAVIEKWTLDGVDYNHEPVVAYVDPVPAVIEKWTLDGVDYNHEPSVVYHDPVEAEAEYWTVDGTGNYPEDPQSRIVHTEPQAAEAGYWTVDGTGNYPEDPQSRIVHTEPQAAEAGYWTVDGNGHYNEDPTSLIEHTEPKDAEAEYWTIDGNGHYNEDPTSLIEHIEYQPRVRYYWTIDGNTQQKFFEDPSQYIIHQKYEPAMDAHWTVNGTGFYEDEPSYVHYNYKPAKPEQWIIDGEDIVYVNPGEPELVNVYNILAPEIVAKFGTKDNKLVGDYDDDPNHWTLVNDLSVVPSTQVMVNVTISPEEYEHITEGTYRMVSTTEPGYTWSEDSPFTDMSIEAFCDTFNSTLRNKYMYAVHWTYLEPLTLPTGNPFDLTEHNDYVSKERNTDETVTLQKRSTSSTNSQQSIFQFENIMDWVDQVTTLNILQNTSIKYNYLNEFTPDDDITIEELKVFRAWLAGILLANTPVVDNWDNPEMLKTMLTYYKQNLNDVTTDILSKFAVHMNEKTLVAGTTTKPVVNLAALGLTSGCGCTGSVAGVGNVATAVCDPLQMYRNAIYNYMVSVFSNIDYWKEQVEICVEMRKYIEGILKVGLPLGSKIIDPLADCTCNTLDSDSQVRYKKMLEALVVALGYIIDGTVAGNKNYVATAFSNWATYLYEYMYWA